MNKHPKLSLLLPFNLQKMSLMDQTQLEEWSDEADYKAAKRKSENEWWFDEGEY